MRLLFTAACALLTACASTTGSSPETTARADDAQAAAGLAIDGLTIRHFRCENGEAFTVQNYQNGSVRVTTRSNRYDLKGSGSGFTANNVTYVRTGDTATLTGADGAYANCRTGA